MWTMPKGGIDSRSNATLTRIKQFLVILYDLHYLFSDLLILYSRRMFIFSIIWIFIVSSRLISLTTWQRIYVWMNMRIPTDLLSKLADLQLNWSRWQTPLTSDLFLRAATFRTSVFHRCVLRIMCRNLSVLPECFRFPTKQQHLFSFLELYTLCSFTKHRKSHSL